MRQWVVPTAAIAVYQLLVVCCCLLSGATAELQLDRLPYANTTFTVCVATWQPFVIQDADTGMISGYDIDLFRMVQARLGFNYTLKVVAWPDVFTGLVVNSSDPGFCDIAPMGMTFTSDSMDMGLLFAPVPTLRSGYSVVVKVQGTVISMWAFARIFSWDMWLALIATCVVLGLLVLWYERDFYFRGLGKIRVPMGIRSGIYETVYLMFCRMLNLNNSVNVQSLASKIVSLSWGLTVLIVIASYTAKLTATLTTVDVQTRFTSLAAMADATVETCSYPPYPGVVDAAVKLNKPMVLFPCDSDDLALAALEKVATGEVDGMVLDTPWLRHYMVNRCDLEIVGNPVSSINQGVAFNQFSSRKLVWDYNFVLQTLLDDGSFEMLENLYMPKSTQNCLKINSDAQISFARMQGLWIVIASAVGVGAILALLPHISPRLDADDGPARTDSAANLSLLGRVGKSLRSFTVPLDAPAHNKVWPAANVGGADDVPVAQSAPSQSDPGTPRPVRSCLSRTHLLEIQPVEGEADQQRKNLSYKAPADVNPSSNNMGVGSVENLEPGSTSYKMSIHTASARL